MIPGLALLTESRIAITFVFRAKIVPFTVSYLFPNTNRFRLLQDSDWCLVFAAALIVVGYVDSKI